MPDINVGPITIKAFLEGADQYLKRGDIVLSRSPNFTSWLIRSATGSAFSHAALVFLVPQPELGLRNTFLLESLGAGVGLANLRDYVSGRHPQSEIAVLRLSDHTGERRQVPAYSSGMTRWVGVLTQSVTALTMSVQEASHGARGNGGCRGRVGRSNVRDRAPG